MNSRTGTSIRTLDARARGGNLEAMFELAERLRKGDGCERDEAAALAWYSRAKDAGHAEAEFLVANWHLRSHFDFPDTPAGRDLTTRYLEHVMRARQRAAAHVSGQTGQSESSNEGEAK